MEKKIQLSGASPLVTDWHHSSDCNPTASRISELPKIITAVII
jgi:hypothetical protein